MKTLHFKTNIHCSNCVAKVKPFLDKKKGVLFAPHANQSGSLQESCAASPEGRQYEAKGVAGNGKV
jgi:copper chaperone CopZ